MPVTGVTYYSSAWKDGIFDNKVVFCTGGSGDICGAQVCALVKLGANACIVGKNTGKAERVAAEIATIRPGARVLGYGAVDVRNISSLDRAVRECVKELGGIDFVIAGAAGNFLAPLTQLSTNAFRSVLEIDLVGSWNTLKATLPQLIASAARNKASGIGGRIAFMSATLQYTGVPLNTHGVVAKAGVDALSAQVAIELGPRGLTSNVIAPGPIEGTEGLERLVKSGTEYEAQKGIPLGRFGTKAEIADATIYLFSSAGNYVNGTTIVVDGGAWRTNRGAIGEGYKYPEFLLSDKAIGGRGSRSPKL